MEIKEWEKNRLPKNKKTMLNDLFEAKEAFDKMLENIINYYIVPFNSGKTPLIIEEVTH